MSNPSFRVLLIGDQPRRLRRLRQQQFEVVCAKRLAGGLAAVRSRHAGLVLMMLIAAGTLQAADPAFPQQVLQTVTNVSQLYRLSQDKQRTICSVRLEGVVCDVTPNRDNMALRDGSGDLDVNMDLRGRSIQPGQKVLVEGTGIMNERGLSLQPVPLVDNDGIHAMDEVAGTISLKAGRYPIRLTWFQGDGPFGLEAYYAGPDLPHQRIPASAVFREQVDPGKGNTNFVPGLNYRYFECATLFSLPEFNLLTPVSTGTVTNFDVSVISRSNNVALEFTGYVEVARDGLYTFSISSDDGSQLFIGEPAPLRLEVLGSVPLPAPHSVVAGQALSAEEDHWWSEVEGTVTFVSEQLNGYELELTSGVGHMRIRLAGDSSDEPVCLLNSQIRVRGFCRSTSTSEGQKVAGLMTIASWKHIQLVQLAAEYWTASPLAPVCGLLTNTLAWTNGAIVRVQGELRPEAADQPLLQDETGEILVEGVQVSPEAFGARVELLGRLDRSGTHAVLRNGFYRQLVQSAGTNAQTLPLLTSAKQIQYLSATEANRNYPVRLRGVVTSSMNYSNSFVLQDATHGIWVNGMGPVTGRRLQIGEFVELEGLTAAGDFAPTITATRVVPLGEGQMPEPIRPNRDQMINGSLDAQYVELQGVVTAVVEPFLLTLLTPAGKYNVGLYETPATDWSRFENALVRIKGCCYASWDAQTHLIKIGETRVFNPSINVDEPAPADLFAAPVKTAAELLLFDAKASALKRIKVLGQVVHERAGEYYLMNGTNGLRVFPKTPVALTLGDRVEVVGFPELGGASPVLREAIMRKTGAAALPRAEPLTANTLLSADHDATLVQVVSQLVGMRASQTEQVLELQTGARTYLARLDTRNGLAPQITLGSRLQLTGVYAGQGGDRAAGRSIDSFELLLNSPADVKVLKRPPWWTLGHTLVVVGALVGVLLLAFAWISGLRRQVNLKTRQLQDEIEERKQAEETLRQAHNELEKRVAERTVELSQERRLMRTLIDNLPDCIYAKDAAGRKILANPADLINLRRKTEAEAIGMSDFEVFPPDMAEKFWADDQKVLHGEPVMSREELTVNDKGEKHWQLTTKLPLRDQNGKIVGLVGIGRNITEQKQAEKALRQSRDELEKRVAERTAELAGANATLQQQIAERERIEQDLNRERLLLRTLIDNLPDAIYTKDTAGRKTMANPTDLKNLRCQTEAEAVGKSDFDLFPKDLAEKFWADDQKVIQGEPVINREEHLFDEAGRKHWLLTSKLPLCDLTGKIVGLVGIGHDITERKEAADTIARERQLLRTLIDRLPETFYIKDLESRFLLANEAQAAQCGKGTPSQLLGLSDADLFSAGLAAEFRAEELKVLAGEPLIDHENTVVFPDGREHTVLTTKLPFRDSQGQICGLVGIGHDITERKRADAALRYEQTLMATLMDNVPAAIYFKDTASRFIRVNRAVSRKFGLDDPARLAGKSDADFFSGEHAQQALADEQKIIRTGQPLLNVEEKETWLDGTVSWVLTTKLPLRDAAGRIIGTCGISLDITERKRVEQALAERTEEVSQRNQELAEANTTLQQQFAVQERIEKVLEGERNLLRTLIDNLPDYVYAQDAEGRFVVANLGMARQLGFSSPNEVIGKSNFDLFPHELAARYHTDEQEIIRSGQGLYHHEGPTVDASKKEKNRWVSTTKVPLRNDLGEVTGFVGLGQDITERKRAEEALRESQALYYSLAEQLPIGVFRKDREGRFVLVNPEFCRLKGMKTEDFLGKTPREVAAVEAAKSGDMGLATKYAAAGKEHHEQILQTGKSIELVEEYESADGRKQFLRVMKSPVIGPDGKIIGSQGIQFDITERKQAEEALQKSSKELQERNDELARFTYTASHDLKSPLVTVKAFLGYLEQDTLSQDKEAMNKDRQYIYTAVDKMSRLLDELLDLARIGSKMNPPEEVPLQVVVKDALDMVAGAIMQKGVEVVSTKEPITLCGDRTRLVEVFQNLVDNAIKFMGDQQTPRVEIGVEKTGEGNVFFVRDNGMGIEPRYQAKVFNLFEKYDPKMKGTGIGLALVKRIVEVHGGKIWVESAGIGKGATFRFTLAKIQRHPAQP